jgi:hypothetical protein
MSGQTQDRCLHWWATKSQPEGPAGGQAGRQQLGWQAGGSLLGRGGLAAGEPLECGEALHAKLLACSRNSGGEVEQSAGGASGA